MTQQGIASSLEVNRTHITRVLRPLLDSGLVEARKGRLEGGERKLSYYVLTPTGLVKAREVLESLGDEKLELVEGGQRILTNVREVLANHPHLRALEVVDSIGGVLRPTSKGRRLICSDQDLQPAEFHGRSEQLAVAREFLEGRGLVLAIFANHGYGSSTFLRKVALDLADGPVFWHDLSKDASPGALWERLAGFASEVGVDGGVHGLKEEDALICLDNYGGVSDALVDMLTDLLPKLRGGRAKLVVAMSEETPSYERFFQRQDVLAGDVTEVRLHRFDQATARQFLGEDLDEEAFQLIYMLTRGQPLALDLVKRGDSEALKKIRLSEEVRFLMYLRTRRKV